MARDPFGVGILTAFPVNSPPSVATKVVNPQYLKRKAVNSFLDRYELRGRCAKLHHSGARNIVLYEGLMKLKDAPDATFLVSMVYDAKVLRPWVEIPGVYECIHYTNESAISIKTLERDLLGIITHLLDIQTTMNYLIWPYATDKNGGHLRELVAINREIRQQAE